MSNNPVRLQSGDGIPITQTDNALDVNIAGGASALPTGAATSAKQEAGNTSLSSIDGKLPALVDGKIPVDASVSIDSLAKEATLASIKTATEALAAKQAATTITEYNITLTLADTEYSQALPANTKKIEFWSRGKYQFRHAFTTGKVAGLVQPYFTAFANSCYESPGMADLTSKIIYFATDSAGDVIEMRVWS